MSRIDSVWSGLEEIIWIENNVSGVIGGKEKKVTELLQLSNSSEKENIFEGLSWVNEDGSITFATDHPILDGHFGNEDGTNVQIIPWVYLRSLALAEYQKNGGKNPIEWLKFNFIGMVVPNDTLVWDIERNGFYKSADTQKNLCIQVEEVVTLENTLLIKSLSEKIRLKPLSIPTTDLDRHLPQKPPFRFAENFIPLWETTVVGSMQIRNPNQLNGAILEEFAAQTMSYHKSKKWNTEGFRAGTIGTFESSQTHFDDSLISEIEINSTIYVVWRLKTEEEEREITGESTSSKKNITNIMEYSLFNSNGICIGFGRLTGTIMKWKTFKRIRTAVWKHNTTK